MKNRFYAATTLVLGLVSVSDPASAFQQRAQPHGCGNLAQYIPRLAQEFGWTREQAIGALANFAHESRGRAIEQIGMPAGTGGFGWAQWTGARRLAFMSFARASGMSPASDAANYGFLAHELRTTYAHVAQRMRAARSAAEATVIFARDYEGAFSPGAITALSSRHQWAQALGAISGAAATPVAVVTQPAVAAATASARPVALPAGARRWYATTARTTARTWAAAKPAWRGTISAAARPATYARVASLRSGYYGYWVTAR